MDNLSELIAKVEALTGASREVDCALYQLEIGDAAQVWRLLPHWTEAERDRIIPHYTVSLEAVVALAEHLLPGKYWLVGKGRLTPREPLYGGQILDGEVAIGNGETDANAAIALLLALLKALRSPNG